MRDNEKHKVAAVITTTAEATAVAAAAAAQLITMNLFVCVIHSFTLLLQFSLRIHWRNRYE